MKYQNPYQEISVPIVKEKWGSEEDPRNWHRDHDAIKNTFRGWLCGDCNMAKHDHRFNIS